MVNIELEHVVKVFISVVNKIMKYRSITGAKFYAETKAGRYINFKPKIFRLELANVVGEELVAEYLELFRKLKLIVVEKSNRYTNIQKIKKKSARVITVDKEILDTLIELTEKGD